jgi:two-component system phosphate regulon response regulator PhoB
MATILVVDDEPSIRRYLRMALERAGYQVREAEDGSGALREARQEPPDLVLLDVALPGLSGLEVCRQLRADPKTGRTPVLLLSGLSSPFERETLLATGASGWLSKPFTPMALLEHVRAALAAPAGLPAR